ncbi:MAG TPA: DUF4363 family protein [Syntrophomonadaceae bacterium]|nr:DUF4363 family protein [Syntrophomonadaceae bacterium]
MNKWGGYLLVFVIVVIIGVGGALVQRYLDRTAGELSASLQEVGRALDHEDWEQGERAFAGFEQRWRVVRRNWALVVDHVEIDSVDMRLARLKEFIRAREDDESLAEYGEALMLLEHIPERERLTWRNLF